LRAGTAAREGMTSGSARVLATVPGYTKDQLTATGANVEHYILCSGCDRSRRAPEPNEKETLWLEAQPQPAC
jgi:hypothetical protein